MAAKEFKINLPNGVVVRTMANSAQQAGKRAEKLYAGGKHVVDQQGFISNVTRKSVADRPGVKVAGSGKKKSTGGHKPWGSPAQRAALKKAHCSGKEERQSARAGRW